MEMFVDQLSEVQREANKMDERNKRRLRDAIAITAAGHRGGRVHARSVW